LRLNDQPLEGLSGSPSPKRLYQWAADRGGVFHHSAPAAGDLVFFHNTYDRDGDGCWDDLWTWVAVVEAVQPNGAVAALGYLEGRVVRLYLHVARPHDAVDGRGAPLNSLLRADAGPHGLLGSAGALFAGFASLPRATPTVRLFDRWHPEAVAWHSPLASSP
jgi:hypothetical protein